MHYYIHPPDVFSSPPWSQCSLIYSMCQMTPKFDNSLNKNSNLTPKKSVSKGGTKKKYVVLIQSDNWFDQTIMLLCTAWTLPFGLPTNTICACSCNWVINHQIICLKQRIFQIQVAVYSFYFIFLLNRYWELVIIEIAGTIWPAQS